MKYLAALDAIDNMVLKAQVDATHEYEDDMPQRNVGAYQLDSPQIRKIHDVRRQASFIRKILGDTQNEPAEISIITLQGRLQTALLTPSTSSPDFQLYRDIVAYIDTI